MSVQMTMTTLEEFNQQYPDHVVAEFMIGEIQEQLDPKTTIKVHRRCSEVRIRGVDYALDEGWVIKARIPGSYVDITPRESEQIGRALIEAAEWIKANSSNHKGYWTA